MQNRKYTIVEMSRKLGLVKLIDQRRTNFLKGGEDTDPPPWDEVEDERYGDGA